jgi:hypothetical protein
MSEQACPHCGGTGIDPDAAFWDALTAADEQARAEMERVNQEADGKAPRRTGP